MLAWLIAAASFVWATQASATVENAGLLEVVLRFVLGVAVDLYTLSVQRWLAVQLSISIACCQMLRAGMSFMIHCSHILVFCGEWNSPGIFVLSLFTLLTLHYDLFWWLCCCCCSCSWLWFPNNLGFVCFVSFVYLQRCYKTRVWISREETQQNPPAGCEIWSSLPIVKSSQTSLGWPDA